MNWNGNRAKVLTREFERDHPPQVVMAYHDDWLVNVLIDDGRVYTFLTEMWPVHGVNPDEHLSNMPGAVREAKRLALWHADRNTETWGLDAVPETEEQFRKAINFVAMRASDQDFRRYTLR